MLALSGSANDVTFNVTPRVTRRCGSRMPAHGSVMRNAAGSAGHIGLELPWQRRRRSDGNFTASMVVPASASASAAPVLHTLNEHIEVAPGRSAAVEGGFWLPGVMDRLVELLVGTVIAKSAARAIHCFPFVGPEHLQHARKKWRPEGHGICGTDPAAGTTLLDNRDRFWPRFLGWSTSFGYLLRRILAAHPRMRGALFVFLLLR